MKTLLIVLIVFIVIVGGLVGYNIFSNRPVAYDLAPKTYDNLLTAQQGESTAKYNYSEFAITAQREGHTSIQRLFTAAAYAEQIHNARQYNLSKAMKPHTPAVPVRGEVGTTAKNLKAAIEGEMYEYADMYPKFYNDALAEGYQGASTIFTYAIGAEESHAKLFLQEFQTMNKVGTYADDTVSYFVCPVCGKIEKGSAPFLCNICGTPFVFFVRY